MFTLFYRNLRLLILTLILIGVWGSTAFFSLPRLEDPELTARNAVVTTLLPGASAERVETLLTDKIEQALLEMEEIDTIESTSRLGISIVQIELNDDVNPVDNAWSRIRDQISDTIPFLPPSASDPEFEISTVGANALIVGLTWDPPHPVNNAVLRRQAEALQSRLRGIPGTAEVELFGDPEEEIGVEIQPSQLARLGLTPQQLAAQIAASDAKVTAGQLRSPTSQLLVEVQGELDSLERIRQIPIRFGSGEQFARLGDIAQVEKTVRDPLSELALFSGKRGIGVAAKTVSGARVDDWAVEVRQQLEDFQTQLPSGINVQVILDQSRYVEARLNSVISNLLVGALLVIGVTLFMMGWRSALMVGSALPLSALMVFGSMKWLGIPLHQISVTGIIIALGLLIDNAIIIVDEVQTRLQSGWDPGHAVHHTTQRMAVPLLSSTLTTVLAFMPIALAPGGVGEFTGTIGVTVILALTSSLILSLTVIPALVGHFQPSQPLSQSAWWQVGFSNGGLTRLYRRSIAYFLARPWWGIGLGLVLPLAGFMVAPQLPQQFFPPAGRDQFYIELALPIQTSITETQAVVAQATSLITAHPAISDVAWFIGNAAPRFYYNVIGGSENSPNYAQALVQLHQGSPSPTLLQTVQDELDQTFPAAQFLVRQLEQGPPFAAPVEMRLYGSDLEELQRLGEQVRAVLAGIPAVIHTRASLTEALPTLGLALDDEQTGLVGLNKTTIAQQLAATLEGAVGGSILEGTEEIPVRVRGSQVQRADLAAITSLDLVGAQQQTLPLNSLGQIRLTPDPAVIARRQGERVNTIQAFLTAGILPSTVLAELQTRLSQINWLLPPGYRYEFGGESDARGTSIANLLSTVGVLSVLMVATLVLSFNSFWMAGLIGIIAACAMGLGLGALFLSGYPFGFTAILGTLGLVGLAINDSIVVLSALQEDPAARHRDPTAMLGVVMHCTRHVIATTVTTLVGFTPLLFDATGFWPPLAICIAGGLGGTTLMALYVVPCVYLLLGRPSLLPPEASHSPPTYSSLSR
ncbi:MAG: efflux RND transporter permease subunit [Cyanobacteriota bacterium]|nr:efflux RND transporter permease subunit [Cyanobacteriota bacterium]